ncbi:MAG TPA: aminotransferase class V-fold PLP-dependent enzyme [Acidimicrobiales bacterium]|nr:aminotransferase class V-fold PLP-dependent enzyme [Acidimicrobiales bacterium]
MTELRELLRWAADRAADYRTSLADRPVQPPVDVDAIRKALGDLDDAPTDPQGVLEQLVDAVTPALTATAGPRYFGFVTGGALDAATAADVLTTGWDQLAYNQLSGPAAAIVEEVVGAWLKELLGLPSDASFGLVTGTQAAHNVALGAARHKVLADAGWDVERDGLFGAPRIRVVASEERHATIDRALRFLGFGTAALEPVRAEANGAIDISELAHAIERGSEMPTIVCLQAGNVNTGACDDLRAACELARGAGAWVHVDGAFGLWAAASPLLRHLCDGIELADSWGTDGHKMLNVPYDSGYVFCAHPDAHAAALAYTASYLVGASAPDVRSPGDFVPESSRRARGFATWAALRELGREGVADLVERTCARARQFGDALAALDGVTIGNDIVLNQVLVRFGDDDATTDRVVADVQIDGTAWMGGTTWRGRRYMRIPVSNWQTSEDDVDQTVDAIRRALGAA